MGPSLKHLARLSDSKFAQAFPHDLHGSLLSNSVDNPDVHEQVRFPRAHRSCRNRMSRSRSLTIPLPAAVSSSMQAARTSSEPSLICDAVTRRCSTSGQSHSSTQSAAVRCPQLCITCSPATFSVSPSYIPRTSSSSHLSGWSTGVLSTVSAQQHRAARPIFRSTSHGVQDLLE